ncbi:MAG: hypothetical protein DDT19_02323 [Syntrophomonadaceae bacterium]|nr:hypothetical protein [Bacillota bacterium]
MAKTEHRVNVYAGEEYREEIIARVRYNDNLDYWTGSNWQNGEVGMHKGLTKLKDGRYVIIIGSQWQGARDYAYVVSAEEALREIVRSGNTKLLETEKFTELKKLQEESLIEEEID